MPERLSFQDQITNNKLKSFVLIVAIFIFFIILGALISYALDPSFFFIIMIFATIFSLIYVLISYYNSDKIALASVGAKPANREQYLQYFNSAENMSLASGLPMPKLYVMESEQINAFASGRDPKNAVLCFTSGALKKLNKQELEGVIGHEMGHIANYDIRFMTLTAVLVGMISIIAQMYLRSFFYASMSRGGDRDDNKGGIIIILLSIVAAILAPLLANLVSLAISRKREFTADATSVKFTRYAPGLTSALKKIKNESISETDRKHFPKAVAPLFISDPFKKKLTTLFSTHPDINVRIKRLERM